MLIVIDGPSGVGKGTMATRLAEKEGFQSFDTGLCYRAVASLYRKWGGDPLPLAYRLEEGDLQRPDLRSPRIEALVPIFSDKPAIRLAVNRFLRQQMQEKGGDWVMEGRAGAYEFSEADVKIFLTASSLVRARRREAQFLTRGESATFHEVWEALEKRDLQDSTREVAPLRYDPTVYPVVIDSSNHQSPEETLVSLQRAYRSLV